MTMQRQLWSINALATELQMDRRTLAKLLDGVPGDGEMNRHPRWHLATALEAIQERRMSQRKTVRGLRPGDGLLELLCERLRSWREVHEAPTILFSLDETAELFRVERETVVTWLRAGMPYVKAGNFETGIGFKLRPSWVIQWMVTLSMLSEISGNHRARKELRLE